MAFQMLSRHASLPIRNGGRQCRPRAENNSRLLDLGEIENLIAPQIGLFLFDGLGQNNFSRAFFNQGELTRAQAAGNRGLRRSRQYIPHG